MKQYYIHDDQIEKGPFDFEHLKSQSLSKETPVWYEGLEDWTMAGNLDELKEYFIRKATPPPLPKAFENNARSRKEILNSFTDAQEVFSEPNKKSFLIPILIFVIIIVIIITIIFLPITVR